jgi:hypothetical protein
VGMAALMMRVSNAARNRANRVARIRSSRRWWVRGGGGAKLAFPLVNDQG